jgi:hypothetical protein
MGARHESGYDDVGTGAVDSWGKDEGVGDEAFRVGDFGEGVERAVVEAGNLSVVRCGYGLLVAS